MHYTFGVYTLDTLCYELRSAKGVIPLDRLGFTLLLYLIQHRDRVVLRQELFDHLWPDRVVTDASLEQCMAVIRRAVGDSGRAQRVIQTIRGRGYRFVAPVEEHLAKSPEVPAPVPPLSSSVPETYSLHAPEVLSPPVVSAQSLPAFTPLSAECRQRPPSTGEYILVTVLCGSLTDTMVLAERLGFDELQRLVQTFHTLAQDCVQRYEGTIQLLGKESFWALFGVPVVREEHAWCAVRAALELQQRLRQEPAVHEIRPGEMLTARLGVHTGWMVADSGSVASLRSVMIGGDTLQGAMRLQALAEPGALLLSDPTLRLLRGTAHSKAYGLVRVPGHTEPPMTYTIHSIESPVTTRVWSPFDGDDFLAARGEYHTRPGGLRLLFRWWSRIIALSGLRVFTNGLMHYDSCRLDA